MVATKFSVKHQWVTFLGRPFALSFPWASQYLSSGLVFFLQHIWTIVVKRVHLQRVCQGQIGQTIHMWKLQRRNLSAALPLQTVHQQQSGHQLLRRLQRLHQPLCQPHNYHSGFPIHYRVQQQSRGGVREDQYRPIWREQIWMCTSDTWLLIHWRPVTNTDHILLFPYMIHCGQKCTHNS